MRLLFVVPILAMSAATAGLIASWRAFGGGESASVRLRSRRQVHPLHLLTSEECGTEAHADLRGRSLNWGLTDRQPTAEACCALCLAKSECNSWVWCGHDLCWSADIWNHSLGECWLKVQEDPDSPDYIRRGRIKAEFRAVHKTAPEMVDWTAGVLRRSRRRALPSAG